MPPYRIAHLAPDQMRTLEGVEDELGLVLVAFEADDPGETETAPQSAGEEDLILDGLVDTYRTFDPQIL